MSLTREQQIALNLAGAVAVPTPRPATARVLAVTDGKVTARIARLLGGDQPPRSALRGLLRRVCLRVVHRISPRLTITRLIPVHEVRAVFVPDDPDDAHLDRGRWYLPGEVAHQATSALAERYGQVGREAHVEVAVFACPGIVYLAEAAPLLMQVEVSMTAAESAEYYPPLPHDRSLNFLDYCDELKKWPPPILS